ncbi:unnamed protein product [Lymnaea stagnalis]|uniref:Uncharacterized protein n=1 Tax=Lymnaea stagnalis TaxID=6523 RepID=A0AAV2HHL5_LYMST
MTTMKTVRVTDAGLSAQDLIQLPKASMKYGILRRKNSKINFGKWPHRFVVLLHGAVYIYNDENAKSACHTFSLVGYNCVQRVQSKTHEHCFEVLPAQISKASKKETFACLSNVERKDWMLAIKQQIYTANNVDLLDMSLTEKLKSLSMSDEDEYKEIEEKVFSPGDKEPELAETSEDEDESSESEEEEPQPEFKKTKRSLSMPQAVTRDQMLQLQAKFSFKYSGISSVDEEDEHVKSHKSKSQKGSNLHRTPSDPQPPPPRYSEVVTEEEPDYVNLNKIKEDFDLYETPPDPIDMSLEVMCTVIDDNPDRDHLIIQLQAKRAFGTYLIRKSRQSDQKILSFLTRNGHVKEYRIYNEDHKVFLERSDKFNTVDELLQHYTNVGTLPLSDYKLKYGFHSVNVSETL